MNIYLDDISKMILQSFINNNVEGATVIKPNHKDILSIVRLDGSEYIFKKLPLSDKITILRVPIVNFLDIGLTEPVINDVNKFIHIFKELSSQLIPEQIHTEQNPEDYEFEKFGIASDGFDIYLTQYVSPFYIELCRKTGILLSECDYDQLVSVSENPLVPIPEFNSEFVFVFEKLKTILNSNKNNAHSTFKYNDGDNCLYYDENDDNEMIVNRSQNVVYAYVRNKLTGVIKVFNSVIISTEKFEEQLNDFVSEKISYLEAISRIMDSNGYPCYPVSLDDFEDHLKSPAYYLNTFSSDFNLIYDSFRGYNTQSMHVSNMIIDIDVFKMLIEEK